MTGDMVVGLWRTLDQVNKDECKRDDGTERNFLCMAV